MIAADPLGIPCVPARGTDFQEAGQGIAGAQHIPRWARFVENGDAGHVARALM
jgi:hypothetical protein